MLKMRCLRHGTQGNMLEVLQNSTHTYERLFQSNFPEHGLEEGRVKISGVQFVCKLKTTSA